MGTDGIIRVGTSGYSFKDWFGPFYPERLPRGRILEHYARFFDTVEINATYYRIPTSATIGKMLDATPKGFDFTVKLHGSMTHERARDEKSFLDLLEAVKPLREAGRLVGLLAQFPYEFKAGPDNHAYIGWVADRLDGIPLFAEFRHDSWMSADTFELLRGLGIGYCSVDEPKLRGLLPPVAKATGPTGYVRFHGRNETDWWRPRPGSDRYLYEYSDRELAEWVPKIRELASKCSLVLVYFNNSHFGHAPKNALRMKELLDLPGPILRQENELNLE